ncbi:hypothetical protein COL80_07465 [Bacillus thuringiensis]|uniref:hypothetical protein n=1 Tax=Bacillus thuringiensis TaxID=1428 RepID=UPI000BF8C1C3|nr:hypothetical protein [Bacillus thuringiensis]PGA28128.1 hypothetical protein COL80_07465 [Bacillus thuringiensis]
MSNSTSWLDEIIAILTELDGAGTLNQIKTKVMERNKIDLNRYQHEQSIAVRIRKTIYQVNYHKNVQWPLLKLNLLNEQF